MTNAVTEAPAAWPEQALVHFQSAFAFDTDCGGITGWLDEDLELATAA